jgi:hypothetical protein
MVAASWAHPLLTVYASTALRSQLEPTRSAPDPVQWLAMWQGVETAGLMSTCTGSRAWERQGTPHEPPSGSFTLRSARGVSESTAFLGVRVIGPSVDIADPSWRLKGWRS